MSDTEFSQRQRRRVVAPNTITAFGLCCGLFIIFKSMLSTSGQQELFHRLQGLAVLLICSIVADFSDGAVARIMKAESAFGEQFDSLSDAVTFGIAPSLITIKSVEGIGLGSFYSSILLICSMIYSLCGVLRLVRYTIMKHPNNTEEKLPKGFFKGLPIPAAAASIVSLALFLSSESASALSLNLRLLILWCGQLLLGGLMVSRCYFPSLGALRFKISSFLLIVLLGIVACLLFLGIIDHFVEVFFLIAWTYIFVIFPLSALFRKAISKSRKN
ncbi:CDP-alcohol phosphatidyltransferase family protein [Chlamydiifrater phoenicopteri]|uniref:CDP-alcohol phosphatidyltransferase family protein n=1 Tax=Chlamydiifrater phoenicopteri TaxID=2681469 RepID=UPI001BCC15D5|nr:phosphatidylcholine/phosphatidylserine synthase [Chlamydiifrater phoenicopteri]